MAGVVARHDDQAGRALVEPVHYPRSHLTAGRRPTSAAAEQRVNERARMVAGRRVNHHPGRLVDDEQVFIFIHDFERNRLRHGHRRVSLGNLDLDDVSGRHSIRGIGSLAVDPDQATLDEPRGGRPAQIVRVIRDEAVEPECGLPRDYLTTGLRSRYPAIRAATPMLMAESATLNTGKKWKFTKSVTVPNTIRS